MGSNGGGGGAGPRLCSEYCAHTAKAKHVNDVSLNYETGHDRSEARQDRIRALWGLKGGCVRIGLRFCQKIRPEVDWREGF